MRSGVRMRLAFVGGTLSEAPDDYKFGPLSACHPGYKMPMKR